MSNGNAMAGAPLQGAVVGHSTGWYRANERLVLGTLGIVVCLALWEGLVSAGLLNPLFASSPSRVLTAGTAYFTSGSGFSDLQVTASEFA